MKDFNEKLTALFACLDDASKVVKGTLDQSVKRRNSNILVSNPYITIQNSESSLTHMRGKESIFRRPEMPIGRCLKPRKTADYKINPHKWIKYTLSDVDISDRTNTCAAFAFLKEVDGQQKLAAIAAEVDTEKTTQKIEFKKSSILQHNISVIESNEIPDVAIDKRKLKGSKFIMPEYVVGQKRQKSRRKSYICVDKTQKPVGNVSLPHLFTETEENT